MEGVGLDVFEQFQTVDAGHHEVGQDKIEAVVGQDLDCFAAVRGEAGVPALHVGEDSTNDGAIEWRIVNDQDFVHLRSPVQDDRGNDGLTGPGRCLHRDGLRPHGNSPRRPVRGNECLELQGYAGYVASTNVHAPVVTRGFPRRLTMHGA